MLHRFLVLLACALAFAPHVAVAQSQKENGARLAATIEAIKADNWQRAGRLAANIPDRPARIYYEWRRLRSGLGDWADYPKFVKNHADWPGLPLLRRVGEGKIPPNRPPEEIIAYFTELPPQTGEGALKFADALQRAGRSDQVDDAVRTAWKTLPMGTTAQAAFMRNFGRITKPLAWTRANHMIWEGQFTQASQMLPLLDAGRRKLAEARIALRKGRKNVNPMINAIPSAIASKDAGLRFDRFRWRMRRDLWDGAEELLKSSSSSREKLGRPDVWSKRRLQIARRAMRAGRYTAAYDFARRHHLRRDEDGFVDAEWLSGYIALRYLNRPEDAITHFRRLRQSAVTPITSGRIWYWLGRAHKAAGNTDKAAEAYGLAARYQTSFYGQLGAEAGDIPDDPKIAGLPNHDWKSAPFLASTVLRAGLLLHYAGERYEGGRFFAHLAETMTEEDQAKLGQLLIDLDRPNMALRVAKNAARLGRVTINSYYPVTPLAGLAKGAPPELVMAIARQETELNPDVVSPVGAQGLMQVMPRTARAVAKQLGVAYSSQRMMNDWQYNARLGVAYLAGLVRQYDGSYVLSAAAYNAGPGRVSQWIKAHGDPRSPGVDPIDWIEKIPFSETRNYVQRVLESTNVYRARLTGDASGLMIGRDIARGRTGG